MARPTFTPMFEEDENTIRDRLLGRVPDTWRKESGDFMYDALAPSALEVKQEQIARDYILKNGFAQYAEGNWLDDCCADIGLTRKQATASKRSLTVTAAAGVSIPAGQTVSVVILDDNGDPLEFTVASAVTFATAGSLSVSITCKTLGSAGNVPTGSQFIFVPSIPGITTIADAGTTVPGTDTESDDELYARYDFKVRNPDTGGNRNDYVRWAKNDVPGVGNAKCLPLWNGNGTVKVVIVGADMLPASSGLVNEVQTYLDPGSTGLGDGKAPCGSKVTVVAATSLPINVAATVTYANGYTPTAVKASFSTALAAYLTGLVFTGKPVVFNYIGSLLMTTQGVENYSGLTVNGGTADVLPSAEQAATVGTVTM